MTSTVRADQVPVAPQPDLDLDARTLRTWQAVDEDGDPVLVLKDESATVVIDVGFGGSWDAAIRAAENLSDMALLYATRLRVAMARQQAAGDRS